MLNVIGRNKSNGMFSHNSTKIFRELIMQYKQKREEGKKINKQLLIKSLQNKIKNIECNEKDFIIRETRRNIKIKNKVLDNFGDKSLFHIDKANKIDAKIKIEKSKLLNPFLDYKSTEPQSSRSKKSKNNDKYNSHKIIQFPNIINRVKKNNEFKSFEIKNFTNNNSITNRSNNESCTPIRKYFSPTKDDSKDSTRNYYLSLLSESNAMSKKKSSPNILRDQLKTPLSERNNSSFNRSKKNSMSSISSLINIDYIKYMQSIKDKFLLDEQKKEKYFEYNQYGCDGFKLKYKYLKENYFN